jgi:hypothetical protein
MNIDSYLKKVIEFTEKDIIKELEDICVELHINPKRHMVFIHTGGISYTLDSIVTDIYLSRRPLNDDARQKLLILHILLETDLSIRNIFWINEELDSIKKPSWDHDKILKQKNELTEKISTKIRQAYQNCFTCADHPNGCKGEDSNCCVPEYKDWRPKE